MNAQLEKILKPLNMLKDMYSSNSMLSGYMKIFDGIIEKEKELFNLYYENPSKYIEELTSYRNILKEKCNKNIDPNLYDIYNAEIDLISVNIKKLNS